MDIVTGRIGSYTGGMDKFAKKNENHGEFDTFLEKAQKGDGQELKKVCREFEGIILEMMYKQMKSSVAGADVLAETSGRRVFEEMLDEKMAEEASKGRGTGLADMLYKQLAP